MPGQRPRPAPASESARRPVATRSNAGGEGPSFPPMGPHYVTQGLRVEAGRIERLAERRAETGPMGYVRASSPARIPRGGRGGPAR